MPDYPSHLEVKGLFGQLDPSVKFRLPERITILTGPNGSGKTHVLKLLRHLVAPDQAALSRLPFESVALEYESGKLLQVGRISSSDGSVELTFRGALPTGEEFQGGPYSTRGTSLYGLGLPDFMHRVDDDLWVDLRDDEMLTSSEVYDRYVDSGSRFNPAEFGESSDWPPRWITEHFAADGPPTFIATARLDLVPVPEDPRRSRRAGRTPGTAARIRQYVDRIRTQVAEARRASLAVSQKADQEFASRALDRARDTVKDRELQSRYEQLARLQQELHSNGLTAESMGVSLPGKTNPTERRILNVFLDDWEEKLRPLIPVHEKLQLLREIVGKKLSVKTLVIENGEPNFTSGSGEPISVEMLSSGEQHLLALFTMLLFAAVPGSIVLVDEPEISLHAAWKHAFLDDITRVAALNDLQVVIATHSTAIINGRWDLVEELEVPA